MGKQAGMDDELDTMLLQFADGLNDKYESSCSIKGSVHGGYSMSSEIEKAKAALIVWSDRRNKQMVALAGTMTDFKKQLDDIMQDLMIGHNFEYAREAIINIVQEYCCKHPVNSAQATEAGRVMSNNERIEQLRAILKPVIDWYVKVQTEGEPSGSYLYDTTYEIFGDHLGKGDFQKIIELLKPSGNQAGKKDE